MNFSFRESSPQANTKIENSTPLREFSPEQLQLLEERRASIWLHSHIKESVTEESKEHDKHLAERMLILGLTADDYEFFIDNYARIGVANRNVLH